MTTPPPSYGPPPGSSGQQPSPYAPPPSASPYGYAVAPPSGKRPVRTWDVVVTIILLVLLGILTLFISFFGFFLVMASDPCGSGITCNSDLIGLGVLVAVALPWVVLIIAAVVAIVLLVKRRIAFWVPLAASPLVIASWFVGAVISAAGVPSG